MIILTRNVSKMGKGTAGFLERIVSSIFDTGLVLVASCAIAPQRLKIINRVRVPAGGHLPVYNCMVATIASMAKLSARASVHSTIGSLRRKKRTTIMPGQTKRNQNITAGRTSVSVNTKYTRPAATAARSRGAAAAGAGTRRPRRRRSARQGSRGTARSRTPST